MMIIIIYGVGKASIFTLSSNKANRLTELARLNAKRREREKLVEGISGSNSVTRMRSDVGVGVAVYHSE